MAGSAGLLGGLAIGGAFATPVLSDSEHDNDDDGPPEMPEDQFEDDVEILNYARTLEFLEARFYEEALDNISEEDLLGCGTLKDFGDPIQDRVYDDLGTIQEHEEIHAETLGAVVEQLDGEPVAEPEFDFGSAVQRPDEFISTAAQIEDVGVSAYAGAAPFIENADIVPPALSIHSVEARHASFLRVLDMQIGFPEPFDAPRTRSEVEEIAGQFIV